MSETIEKVFLPKSVAVVTINHNNNAKLQEYKVGEAYGEQVQDIVTGLEVRINNLGLFLYIHLEKETVRSFLPMSLLGTVSMEEDKV